MGFVQSAAAVGFQTEDDHRQNIIKGHGRQNDQRCIGTAAADALQKHCTQQGGIAAEAALCKSAHQPLIPEHFSG